MSMPNIPPQLDDITPGLWDVVRGAQAESLREFGRFINWEGGWQPFSIIPGTTWLWERYSQGDAPEQQGHVMRMRYTDGVSTAEKVINHGPGDFAHDWHEVIGGTHLSL